MTIRSDGASFSYRDPCTGGGVLVDPDELDADGRISCPVCDRPTKVSRSSGMVRFHRVPLPPPVESPSLRSIAHMSRDEILAIAPVPCLCGCGKILPPPAVGFASAKCIEKWAKADRRARSTDGGW